jgi:hypothetical protein
MLLLLLCTLDIKHTYGTHNSVCTSLLQTVIDILQLPNHAPGKQHVCVYSCMYACMHVCIYAFMYVCLYMYTCRDSEITCACIKQNP